jgi:hypothetical protein
MASTLVQMLLADWQEAMGTGLEASIQISSRTANTPIDRGMRHLTRIWPFAGLVALNSN